MSHGIAIHTDSGAFPLRNGRRSFEKIQDKKGFIYFRVPLGKDEYVTEAEQGSFELGSDFSSLIKEAIEKKAPFVFCYFRLSHNDSDDDIISLFKGKVIVLPKDRKVLIGIPYKII